MSEGGGRRDKTGSQVSWRCTCDVLFRRRHQYENHNCQLKLQVYHSGDARQQVPLPPDALASRGRSHTLLVEQEARRTYQHKASNVNEIAVVENIGW